MAEHIVDPSSSDQSENERLLDACRRGNNEELEAALNAGANPNGGDGYGWTPLHLAAGKGDLRAVRLLLAFGANPNVASTGGTSDRLGVTPLHEACTCNALPVIEALLSAGADLNPLARACRLGASPQTPLDVAESNGNQIAAEKIRAAGGRRRLSLLDTTVNKNKQRGMLIGLAVGDALGAAVEFQEPGSFEPVTGFRAGGPHGLAPGEWTDDTSMALALADSLAAGWSLDDQARRYVAWWRHGRYSVNGSCFDIGTTTRAALSCFERNGNAQACGQDGARASGNGSIMRLAPVAIRYAVLFPDRLDELVQYAVESSVPTHASWECLSACAYLAVVLCGLVHGVPREEVLRPDWEPLARAQRMTDRLPQGLLPEVQEVARGSFRRKRPPEIRGAGYVVRTLEAALWAFHDAADFREAVLRAVNLGEDADTTGAVCGQLAGACWGESGIPLEWQSGLGRRDLLETALKGLLESDV